MLVFKSSDIYSKKIDNQVVILEKNKEHVRQLNEVASFLWENLKKPKSIDQLVSATVKEFDVDQKQAKKDVEEWVADYLDEGFLQEVKN